MIIIKNDIYFIISAFLIWIVGVLYSLYDFVIMRRELFVININLLIFSFIIILGIIIRIHCRKKLRGGFTFMLQTKKSQELVTDGIYSLVRHPGYIADYSIQVSFTLLLGSVIGFCIMVFLIFPFLYRIKIEEQMLIGKFGSNYIEYQKSTKRLIPLIY